MFPSLFATHTQSMTTEAAVATPPEGLENEESTSVNEERKDNEDEGKDEGKEGKVDIKAKENIAPTKVSDRYNEDDAEVTIISSDNVLFKVHSFILKSSSYVVPFWSEPISRLVIIG